MVFFLTIEAAACVNFVADSATSFTGGLGGLPNSTASGDQETKRLVKFSKFARLTSLIAG